MEGFHYLFHPVTRRALELAGDGTLGELTRVEVRMAHARTATRRSALVARSWPAAR